MDCNRHKSMKQVKHLFESHLNSLAPAEDVEDSFIWVPDAL